MSRFPAWGLWVGLVALGFAAEADAKPRKGAPEIPSVAAVDTDAVVNAAVVLELMIQPGVRSDQVQTETRDGVVRLTGTLDNLLAAERAVEITRAVVGVRAVVDALEVRPPPRSDAQIASDLIESWALDPVTETYQLLADVGDGVVSITGSVASHQERDLAERLAKAIVGVRRVDNHVQVRRVESRQDVEIRADVRSRMHWDVRLDDPAIRVAVQDGIVTLEGVVGSVADQAIAEELARVAGAKHVENRLEVKPAERGRRLSKEKRPIRADDELFAAVHAALAYDPRVPGGVSVQVQEGIVTLRGVVPTPAVRHAAERAAMNTVGVWSVRNELQVAPPVQLDDDALQSRVERAIRRDAWLAGQEVQVRVSDGLAYLYGMLDSDVARSQALSVVGRIGGVREVMDRLVVSPDREWADDAPRLASDAPEGFLLAQRVRNRLFWSGYVRSPIRVEVDGRRVHLSGAVDTWFERYKATLAAWEAGAGEVVVALEARDAWDLRL